jgi:AraC-like DNA-binding protein
VDRLLFTTVHTPIRLVITEDAEPLHSLWSPNRALIYSTDRRTQGFDVPSQHRDYVCSHDVINLFQQNNLPSADRSSAARGYHDRTYHGLGRCATGTTPTEYLSDWRLTLAMSQIRSGAPVKLIAADLGYASASSLSKAFKQRFGTSPRGWSNGL